MNIYIGNLSKDVTEDDLQEAFSKYGAIKSVKVIKDLFTSESKGFGFVEMNDKDAALKAIEELNTSELKGKKLVVNEARPKSGGDRKGGRGNGGGGGHRGGFNGGGNRGGGGGNRGGGKRW